MAQQHLAIVSLLVREYDEAIAFYTQKLGVRLKEDTVLSPGKRWVIVSPPGAGKGCDVLLARADGEVQENHIGNQTGGRVFLFLYTDDIARDYQHLLQHAVTIIRQPQAEAYGTVLVFADLYGNLWDLIQPVKKEH